MGAITGAIIAASVIGAGGQIYASEQQKKAAEDAQRRADEAKAREEAEALRIAQDTRPEGKAVEGVKFGVGDETTGTFDEFLKPKTDVTSKSGLGTAGTSGLGFAV